MSIPFIATNKGVSFTLDFKPYSIHVDNPLWADFIRALKAGDEECLQNLVNIKGNVTNIFGDVVQTDEGDIYFQGVPMPDNVVLRANRCIAMTGDATPILRFLNNLGKNPDPDVVSQLFDFISVSELPITEDGCFLAYKMVRKDYTDIYTGTMDNSVGATPEMNRSEVVKDPNKTCEAGLHFAALKYVEEGMYGKSSRGDRLMVVKVNPYHVVSIPKDYDNSKGRACKYVIVSELEWTERLESLYTALFPESEYPLPVDEENAPESDSGASQVADSEQANKPKGVKLNEAIVSNIKKDIAQGDLNMTQIANRYGVSPRQIGRIRDGKAWKHVK